MILHFITDEAVFAEQPEPEVIIQTRDARCYRTDIRIGR